MAQVEEYDVLGIGFGPANLSLAIALRESAEATEAGLRFHFVEKQPAFAWHSALLLPGSQLQVSPVKDLATMRDPTSSYTFTNYLHQQGRLAAFVNREASIPSRREWSAYLHWAAKRMEDVVDYGCEVVSVEPIAQSSDDAAATANANQQRRITSFRVTTRNTQSGDVVVRLAKNITVAVGGVPVVPTPFTALHTSKPSHVVHSSAYLPSLAAMEPRLRATEARRGAPNATPPAIATVPSTSLEQGQRQLTAPLRFAVVGSGQSAAEISLHLRKTFPVAHVSLIFRASAVVPSDDSAFVNATAFDPDRTDAFWRAGDEERKTWLSEFRRTNYSVVRSDVLNELHNEVYDQSIELAQPWPHADGPTTHGRLELRPNTQVDHLELVHDDNGDEAVHATIRNLKYPSSVVEATPSTESFDAVFLATGFARGPDCMSFLRPLQSYYPRLDADVQARKAALGFRPDEVDSFDALAKLQNDETAAERLRQRVRGITRDYRLVGYASDAFASSSSSSPLQHSSALTAAMQSGTSTPRRGSDMSDSDTLADSDDHLIQSQLLSSRRASLDGDDDNVRAIRGPKIDASVYFLGGNEATHGLSDSLLSIVAHRAGELTTSLVKRHALQSRRQRSNDVNVKAATTTGAPPARKGTITAADCAPSKAKLKTLPVETVEEKVRTMHVA